jgi:hypothetical protein
MMKKSTIVVAFALTCGALTTQFAIAQGDGPTTTQDVSLLVSGSALLKVTGGTNVGGTTVKMSLAGATEAGAAISSVSENSLTRLKISSLADDETPKRKVTALVTTGDLATSKTQLSIELLPPTLAAAENFTNYATEGGTLAGDLQVLSNDEGNAEAITLVSAIRTCWSGTAVDDGYQIHYKFEATGGGTPKKSNVTITFTIEADNS